MLRVRWVDPLQLVDLMTRSTMSVRCCGRKGRDEPQSSPLDEELCVPRRRSTATLPFQTQVIICIATRIQHPLSSTPSIRSDFEDVVEKRTAEDIIKRAARCKRGSGSGWPSLEHSASQSLDTALTQASPHVFNTALPCVIPICNEKELDGSGLSRGGR